MSRISRKKQDEKTYMLGDCEQKMSVAKPFNMSLTLSWEEEEAK